LRSPCSKKFRPQRAFAGPPNCEYSTYSPSYSTEQRHGELLKQPWKRSRHLQHLSLAHPQIRWPERITNEELWRRAKQEPVNMQIRQKKWGWTRHTLRKPPSNTTCQALTWNPQDKRKRRRPRNTWRQDMESELKEHVTTWQEATKSNIMSYWLDLIQNQVWLLHNMHKIPVCKKITRNSPILKCI
jgi:hypothetical protein